MISSVVERFVHIEDVGGSNPSSPTIPVKIARYISAIVDAVHAPIAESISTSLLAGQRGWAGGLMLEKRTTPELTGGLMTWVFR